MSRISIAVPTYNGSRTIIEMLESVLSQSFSDFEIVISDDNSNDDTIKKIESLGDSRIKIFQSSENKGYPGNMRKAYHLCSSPLVFLMAQDDLLADNVIADTVKFFDDHPNAGALSRPYYAFDETPSKPIRYKKTFDIPHGEYKIINKKSDFNDVLILLNTMDQLSGLCYRKSMVTIDFHDDVFPCHVYPFLSVIVNNDIGFVNNYTIAVRVNSSQCISTSSIYDKSPVASWLELFDTIFHEEKYKELRNRAKGEFVCSNWIGLLQIRNYSKKPYYYLLREYFTMVKVKPLNLIHPLFILTMLLCLFTPRRALVPFVNYVKNNISPMTIEPIEFIFNGANIIKYKKDV
ncbi:MAG: glycosyltransferase family 2 protein [Flavobacteriales bacterium]|nr:glycosyltransferase family 2 protein [Leptospiraceae bacterium]MCB9336300.1 glycosyltransferase family 2 protein [Flavobacteriales bacterium]